MSVWDNLGRFNKGMQDWWKDVGLMAAAGPKFAWDIVTAPWNDREEFNGFSNTIRQAGLDYGKNLGRPLGGLVAGLYQTNKNIIWEPAAALKLASDEVSLGTQSKEQNIAGWKKAWETRQEIPFGQVYTDILPWSYGWKQFAKLTGTEENLPLVLQENFDIYDEEQRQKAFKESLYGAVMSGTLDFWKQIIFDVGLGAGKGVQKIRKPDDPIEAIKGIDEALAGKTNKYSSMGEDFAANTDLWAEKHPWVQAGNNPGVSSYLLGMADTKEEALYTMKSLLGDSSAIDKLDALKRPDIAEPIKIANGELTRSELKNILRTEKVLGRTQTEEMLPLSYLRTAEEIQADTEFLRIYAKHDKYIAALMGVSEIAPMTEGIATRASQVVSREIATARSTGLIDEGIIQPTVEIYQPTPFHRMYYKISSPGKEIPAGITNLNEGDSIKEVTATLNQLVKKDLFSQELAASYLSRYAAAISPESKLEVLVSLEEAGFAAIGKRYKLTTDQVKSVFDQHTSLKNGFLKEMKEVGYVYDSITDTNIRLAFFESQTANLYPVADFNAIEKVIKSNEGPFKTAYEIYGNSIESLEFFNDLWKASVLLRGGYPIRNAVDSQLRIMAVFGAMTTMRHMGQGTKNLVENTYNQGSRLIDNIGNYRDGLKPSSYGEIKTSMQKAGSELSEHEAKIKNISRELEKFPDDPDLVAQLIAEKVKYDSKLAVYQTNSDALTALEKTKLKTQKKTLGQEDFKLSSMYESPDGSQFSLHGGFGGPLGPMFRSLNSSERVFARVLDDYRNIYGAKFAKTGSRGKITPDMDNYYKEWADAINKPFANSAVVKELLKPDADIISVANWLETSAEGRKLRARLGLSREESLEYVGTVKGFMDNYMPSGSGISEELAKNGLVTEQFLRDAIKNPDKLPTVHGFLLEENINRQGVNWIKRAINKSFKIIGSMPEDAWARNPLFNEIYERSAQTRFTTYEFLNKKRFTLDEFNEIANNIEAGARADALKGVKEILYNVERRTNLGQALRFISPFFSAQENAIKTWLKITRDKPYIFSRAGALYFAPERSGLIVDENGDPVPPYSTLKGDETIWLQVPESLKKLPLIGEGLKSLDQVGISKRSLDVVFMGSPFELSVGPYFTIPVSTIMKLQPSTEAVVSWAFPYGPPDNIYTEILPTWAKRQVERAQGMDNSTYARMFTSIWLTEQQKAKENGTPYKTDKEIKKMTDALYNTRTWANLILPFATQFQSPYRMYIAKYRQYNENYGLRANEKFLEDYPEFFSFALSLSENKYGSASTMTDVKNAQRYRDLISEVKDLNPSLVGLITRGDETSDFSPTAYWWQEQTSVSPGTAEKFRGALDPKEAIQRNQAREGWVRFRKIQGYVDSQLRSRGLTTVDANGAEDLKILKTATITALASKLDPVTGKPTGEPSAWYVDYLDTDGTKTIRFVQGLKKIVSNPTFMKDNAENNTWKSVIGYLEMRGFVASRLAMRSSKNIDAKENIDLKILMSAIVFRLKNENIGFSDLYDRYLEQDPIYDRYLGVGK
jgi:hypothetical protein